MKSNEAIEHHNVVQKTPYDKRRSSAEVEGHLLKGTILVAPKLPEIDIVLRSLSIDEIRRFVETTQSVGSAPCSEEGEEKKTADKSEVSKKAEIETDTAVEEASIHEEMAPGEQEIVASLPQAEVILGPEPSEEGNGESAVEIEEVDDQGSVESLPQGDSNMSEIANGGLVDAILAMIGELPQSNMNAGDDSLNLMRYRKREPHFDEGVEEFASVVDDNRVAEVVKAANQEMINQIILKYSTAKLANELNKPFTPLDESTSFLEALKKTPSSFAPNTVPVKQRRGNKGQPLRHTKCRYCGGNLRAIDKHRDDGKFALECRNRECLRFNGFTDDQTFIQSLKRPKSEYGWYLSNPMRIYYQLRPNNETTVEDVPPPKKILTTDKAIMVRCPGQKRLCLLA